MDLPERETSRVEVFGGLRLFWNGEQIHLSPQQAALIGYVFGHGKEAIGRSEIVSRFWPNDDPSKARRRLNQLLYSIRKHFQEQAPLRARGDLILCAEEGTSSDLRDFHTALKSHQLRRCATLLEQGFLAEAQGPLSYEYLDWVESRSRELRGTLRKCAERRWHDCERASDWSGASAAADALLALDPLNEKRLRQVLEAQAKGGHSAEAEFILREFASQSEQVHGKAWTPEEGTSSLVEKIRSAEPEPFLLPPTDLSGGMPEPPMLGRSTEQRLLRKTLRRIPHQELRGILLTGEAGIGKTRLVREALLGVTLEGQRVLSAQAADLEQLIPLNPLIEAFRSPWVGERLRGLDEPWRTVLYGVIPSHYLGEGPIPEAPQIQPGSVPRRLFEAFHELLLALVGEGPVILVLEDLQWVDETTLSVLEFLLRRWDQGGLQIIITARSEEVRRHPVLERFLDFLRVHSDFMEASLGDLDPEVCESLIRDLAPHPLNTEEVSYLRSLAGGNPFFLIELTLEFLAGRIGEGPGPREVLPIPLSIRQVLRRRLSQLSRDAERVLGSLAVHTRPLDVRSLTRIGKLQEAKCLAGLDQLQEFRLVATRGAEVTVRHELIRQTVYQDLKEHRKAWLHERVARHLQRTRERPPSDELALHFHRAGVPAEAKRYAVEAADRAQASGAVPEALRFLGIAREHSEDPQEVAALIGRMGHLNYKYRNLEEAAPLLELAAQRFRRFGMDAEALEAEIERIDCLARIGHLPHMDCLEELQRLKAEARDSDNWEVFHKALDVEAHELDRKGDLPALRDVLDQARTHANTGTPGARCKAQAMLALNIYFGSPP
ncbi:AAA family ATPase [Gemmatimonadota bacterium]